MNWRQLPLIAFIIAIIVAVRRLYAPEEDDYVY